MEIARSHDIQLFLRPGIVEFAWGHPDLDLLPVDSLLQATQAALERDGPLALSYGAEQGPICLIKQVCARLGRLEGAAPPRATTNSRSRLQTIVPIWLAGSWRVL